MQRLKVNYMQNAVVAINKTYWPIYRTANGTLVDLRLPEPGKATSTPRMRFRRNALRECGIPKALIKAATRSNPQGLILFEDLPQCSEYDSKSTSQESPKSNLNIIFD